MATKINIDENGRYEQRRDIDLRKNEVLNLYHSEKSIKEISKIMRCSAPVILRVLKSEGISIRPHIYYSIGKTPHNKMRLDDKKIISMYSKGVQTKAIAKLFNVDCSVIYRILKENNILLLNGIKTRFKNGNVAWNKRNDLREKANEIIKLYKDELLSCKEIAKIYSCGIILINNILKEKNILMNLSERRKFLAEAGKLRIWNDGLTKENNEKIRIGIEKTIKWIQENIKNKTFEEIYGEEKAREIRLKLSGENSSNWLGGKSFEPYTPEFNRLFKLAIKQRDGFMCVKCGMREEDHIKLFGRKEHIHHIDYIKENTFPQNCCALCLRCNTEVNKNRIHWTKFFQSLLAERYGYKYDENQNIIINLNNQLNYMGGKTNE